MNPATRAGPADLALPLALAAESAARAATPADTGARPPEIRGGARPRGRRAARRRAARVGR
ncbi:hypothetical protein ACQSMD_23405 [Streptomyces flavovirens]|uniref:hypothetical protein n=1 Tax=Streptomyces flavovirens TaxID=52258 RepID=UPI003D097BDB